MEEAVHPFLAKYTHGDGRLIWQEGIHRLRRSRRFLRVFTTGRCSTAGGGDHLLNWASANGMRPPDSWKRLIHKEYEVGYDQFHQSESYIYFYLLLSELGTSNVERARRLLVSF